MSDSRKQPKPPLAFYRVTRTRQKFWEDENEKLIASQSQTELLSSIEGSQGSDFEGNPTFIETRLSRAPTTLSGAGANQDEKDGKDEKDEKAEDVKEEDDAEQPNKRRKIRGKSLVIDTSRPSIATIKLAFQEALTEFYESKDGMSFNQKQLTAAFATWFAEVCQKPTILSFAKASAINAKKRDKENKAYNKFIGLMTMEALGIAAVLRPDKARGYFDKYMHNHLFVYPAVGSYYPLDDKQRHNAKCLKYKLKETPSLNFRTTQMTDQLFALDNKVIAELTKLMPTNFTGNERQFVMDFFNDKLNKIEAYFSLRAPEFIICVMHEMAARITNQTTGKDMRALGDMFRSRAGKFASGPQSYSVSSSSMFAASTPTSSSTASSEQQFSVSSSSSSSSTLTLHRL